MIIIIFFPLSVAVTVSQAHYFTHIPHRQSLINATEGCANERLLCVGQTTSTFIILLMSSSPVVTCSEMFCKCICISQNTEKNMVTADICLCQGLDSTKIFNK